MKAYFPNRPVSNFIDHFVSGNFEAVAITIVNSGVTAWFINTIVKTDVIFCRDCSLKQRGESNDTTTQVLTPIQQKVMTEMP
jgi:hypothetical protein